MYEELHSALPRRYVISPTNTTKHTGTIRWYNAAKGVGFIAPNVPGPNLFVHRSSLAPGYAEPEAGEGSEARGARGIAPRPTSAADLQLHLRSHTGVARAPSAARRRGPAPFDSERRTRTAHT